MGEEWHLEELRNWKIWEADFTGNDDSEFNSNYVLTISTDRVSFKSFMGTEARCVVIGKGYNAKTSEMQIPGSGERGVVEFSLWERLKPRQRRLPRPTKKGRALPRPEKQRHLAA